MGDEKAGKRKREMATEGGQLASDHSGSHMALNLMTVRGRSRASRSRSMTPQGLQAFWNSVRCGTEGAPSEATLGRVAPGSRNVVRPPSEPMS